MANDIVAVMEKGENSELVKDQFAGNQCCVLSHCGWYSVCGYKSLCIFKTIFENLNKLVFCRITRRSEGEVGQFCGWCSVGRQQEEYCGIGKKIKLIFLYRHPSIAKYDLSVVLYNQCFLIIPLD